MISSIRPASYKARMTVEKGNIYFTDIATGEIKHHIDINGKIFYSHARKNPTPLITGLYFRSCKCDEKNWFEVFARRALTYASATRIKNFINNIDFIESALKVYGEKIYPSLVDDILITGRNVLYTDEQKNQVLKNKKYIEWCFDNDLNPFRVFSEYNNTKVLKELCGEDDEIYEGLRDQRTFDFDYTDKSTWKNIRFVIKVIKNNPMVKYAYGMTNLEICYREICRAIAHYLQMCDELKREPTYQDFMYEYYRTRWIYYNYRAQLDNEKFKNRYSDILNFSYGNLEVVLPTKTTDLTKEGNNNRNCVGSYIKDVLNGRCIIVFIRHKDTPDKSYITCEISPSGKIRQFYLKGNRRVKSDGDKAFLHAYQEYLNSHVSKIAELSK